MLRAARGGERGDAALRDGDRGVADLPVRAALRAPTSTSGSPAPRVWEEPWPEADPALLARDEVEIALQINGKLRDRMPAPASADREQLETLARDRPRVQAHIDGKDVVKVIVVPSKLVNFVVR